VLCSSRGAELVRLHTEIQQLTQTGHAKHVKRVIDFFFTSFFASDLISSQKTLQEIQNHEIIFLFNNRVFLDIAFNTPLPVPTHTEANKSRF